MRLVEILPLLIPFVIFLIPIIAILTRHQQKMAEIMRDQHGQASAAEIYALRREVSELKEIVHQQTLALDSVMPSGVKSVEDAPLQERLR
jgi:hypothetical protein